MAKIWYGLFENGNLVAVGAFEEKPDIGDFGVPFSDEDEYKIVEVKITPSSI